MKRLIIIILSVFASVSVRAQSPVMGFRENYFLTGIPVRGAVNLSTADIKFQVSLKTPGLQLGSRWTAFVGYTQISVWNAYCTSGPFKDNLYMPGVYFQSVRNESNTILTGWEHYSNGRPYFGNPVASEGYEDYSKGLNYAFFQWTHSWGGRSVLSLKARAGAGCGVGDYERHMQLFTQDLLLSYVGYLTADYSQKGCLMDFRCSVTPLYNKSLANVTVQLSKTLRQGWPRLLLEFHYGFDECLCDCIRDSSAPASLRIGLAL